MLRRPATGFQSSCQFIRGWCDVVEVSIACVSEVRVVPSERTCYVVLVFGLGFVLGHRFDHRLIFPWLFCFLSLCKFRSRDLPCQFSPNFQALSFTLFLALLCTCLVMRRFLPRCFSHRNYVVTCQENTIRI